MARYSLALSMDFEFNRLRGFFSIKFIKMKFYRGYVIRPKFLYQETILVQNVLGYITMSQKSGEVLSTRKALHPFLTFFEILLSDLKSSDSVIIELLFSYYC